LANFLAAKLFENWAAEFGGKFKFGGQKSDETCWPLSSSVSLSDPLRLPAQLYNKLKMKNKFKRKK